MEGGVGLQTLLQHQQDDESSTDAFWASLHESALFANDFLLAPPPQRQPHHPHQPHKPVIMTRLGGRSSGDSVEGLTLASSSSSTSSSTPLSSSTAGGSGSVLRPLQYRELIETSPAGRLDSLREGDDASAALASFALSGIVDDNDDDDDEKGEKGEEGGGVGHRHGRDGEERAREGAEGHDEEGHTNGADDEEVEVEVEVDHILADVLALSAAAGESSFGTLLAKRVQLLRRIHEACARRRRLRMLPSRRQPDLHQRAALATREEQLAEQSLFESFTYVEQADSSAPSTVPSKRGKKSAGRDKASRKDGGEDEQEVDPKKQTMETLLQLLSNTTSETRLRENISNILQLFSDLPPYSLFHEEDNKTLDTFEELLISFLSGGQTRSPKQPIPAPSFKAQAQALLLILALMRGSVTTSLRALMQLLEPAKNESIIMASGDEHQQQQQQQQSRTGNSPQTQEETNKIKAKEEALRSIVPYLKQLEDFRKHKELCSLFEEAYQGMWRYNWRDGSLGALSGYSLGQSSGNLGVPGASLPSIASDGRFLYILNNHEGLLKIGTGIIGTHTIRGHVYMYKSKYAGHFDQRCWLVYVNSSLYYKSPNASLPALIKINPWTLEEEGEIKLSTSERDSLQPSNIVNPNNVPMLTDGRYIYLIAETRGAPKNEFKLFAYDPLQSYKCVSTTVLQGPNNLSGQHNGVICDGCQRYAFRGQRYKCTESACRDYNLCHTCQQLGITSKLHQRTHAMDVIAEPQPSNAVPALAPQCLISGYFFTTGHQLGVLLPSGVPPNTLRRNKMMCRIFSIRQGRHINDLMVENWHNGQCICFDRRNNLLWMHAPETSSIMRWTHQGKTSPSFVQTDPMTMLMRYVLPQGKATPQQAMSRQKAAMVLLANMAILAKRVATARPARSVLVTGKKQPFVTEHSAKAGDTLAAIQVLLERALSSKNRTSESAGAAAGSDAKNSTMIAVAAATTTTTTTEAISEEESLTTSVKTSTAGSSAFIISSLLQLLAANLHSLLKVLTPEEAVKTFGLTLLDIRDLLLRLALGDSYHANLAGPAAAETTSIIIAPASEKRSADKTQDRIVQAHARRCLLIGFSIFYPRQDKQTMLIKELLASLKQEISIKQAAQEYSPTRLLLNELLEKLVQDAGTRSGADLSEMFFARIGDEDINHHRRLAAVKRSNAVSRSKKKAKSKQQCLDVTTLVSPRQQIDADIKESTHSGESEKEIPRAGDNATSVSQTARENREKVVRELIELGIELSQRHTEDFKSRNLIKREEEVKSLLEAEGASSITTNVSEEASTINSVLLAVQRDLLSYIDFNNNENGSAQGGSNGSCLFSTSGDEEQYIGGISSNRSTSDIMRLVRWTKLVVQKSLEIIGVILPKSSLREEQDEGCIPEANRSRALLFVNRLETLHESLFGVVIPPLVTSLYHFADRSAFVDVLSDLLALLWELDKINHFLVGSKDAFTALLLAQQVEKQQKRHEAAVALAAAEAARAVSQQQGSKDRKNRGKRGKSNVPSASLTGSPVIASKLSTAIPEQESRLIYPFEWLVELEKTIATLCAKLAGTMVAGPTYTQIQQANLTHLGSHLFSSGLEESEEHTLAAGYFSIDEVNSEETVTATDKDAEATPAEHLHLTSSDNNFLTRLLTADDTDEELGPVIKWINSQVPRLPIPQQAEALISSAILNTLAAIAKHSNLIPELRRWADTLREHALKLRSMVDDMEGSSSEISLGTESISLLPSPPTSIQTALSVAGSIKLWIMQQQQNILSKAMQQYDSAITRKRDHVATKAQMTSEDGRERFLNAESDIDDDYDNDDDAVDEAREGESNSLRGLSQLRLLQQQLLRQEAQLAEDIMWDVMVEEEEDQMRDEDDVDEDDYAALEEDDDILEDDDDEGEEEDLYDYDAEDLHTPETQARSESLLSAMLRRGEKKIDIKGNKVSAGYVKKEDATGDPVMPTREDVYLRLSKQVLAGAEFLLRFAPSYTMSLTQQQLTGQARAIVSFIQLLLPLKPLESLLRLHIFRAKSRCRGLDIFIHLLERCSLVGVKNEIAQHIGRSLRQTGRHYTDNLEGCSLASSLAIRRSFSKLFHFLLSCIANSDLNCETEDLTLQQSIGQLKFQTLLLNALALDYRMFDYNLFSTSPYNDTLHRLYTPNCYASVSSNSASSSSTSAVSSSSSSSSSATHDHRGRSSAVLKLHMHRKRVMRVARDLFLLTSARCLAWNPSLSALKRNHLNEPSDEAKIKELQDNVLKRIFLIELGGNNQEVKRAYNDLDDEYHYSLLALLFKLRRTAAMKRFFSSLNSINNLLYLLQVGSPRVQRLVIRLCRYMLARVQPLFGKTCHISVATETMKEDSTSDSGDELSAENTLEFFINLLGSLIFNIHDMTAESREAVDSSSIEINPINSPRQSSSREKTIMTASNMTSHQRSVDSYTLILHRPKGVTLSDVLRMLPQSQLTAGNLCLDVNLKDVVKELRAIDQTVVLRDASIDKCRRCASLLASKGFCVTIAKPSSLPKTNTEPDGSPSSFAQFYTWRSRRVDHALASEIVTLLRALLKSPPWHELFKHKLSSELADRISGLENLLSKRILRESTDHKGKRQQTEHQEVEDSEDFTIERKHQKRIAALLAILGGWNEDIRVGGRVLLQSCKSTSCGSVGTVISYNSVTAIKVLVQDHDSQDYNVHICSAEELLPVTQIDLSADTLSLTGSVTRVIFDFLKQANIYLRADSSTKSPASPTATALIYAQIRSQLLMVISRLFQDPHSISSSLGLSTNAATATAGNQEQSHQLIPLLINEIAICEEEESISSLMEDTLEESSDTTTAEALLRYSMRGKDPTSLVRMVFDLRETLHELKSRPQQKNRLITESQVVGEGVHLPTDTARNEKEQQNDTYKRGAGGASSLDTKNRRKRDERKGKVAARAGKLKEVEEENNVERIRNALCGHWGASQGKMAWCEDSGYALVFLGLDRLSLQYFGNNGDCLVHALPEISSETMDEFYFEITIDNDESGNSIGVGLCPAGAVPGWGDCFYEYRGNSGNKVLPRQRKETEPVYRCPYCDLDRLSSAELCHHLQRRHNGSTLPVVCPICSSTPLGDPNYISSNFFGHLENTHSDLLYGPVPSSQEVAYGPSYSVGDVIGCGWSRRDGGVIYFTRNGEYVGPAFIDVPEHRLVPMIRLRGSGTELSSNFGHRPFACPPTKDLAEKDSEMVRKLREEQETAKRQLREAEDARLAAREAQADLLMSFVGLPREFCIYALIQNNDNVEEAASWSFDHFNQWSADQAHAQALSIQQEHRNSLSSSNLDESLVGMSSAASTSVNSYLAYPGEAYAFSDNNLPSADPIRTNVTSLSSPMASSTMEVSRLTVGMRCVVTDRALDAVDPTGWVDAKYKAIGRTGEVVAIDRSTLVALLKFYDPERAVSEEWWFPLQSLQIAESESAPPPSLSKQKTTDSKQQQQQKQDLRKTSGDTLQSILLATVMRLSQFYARDAVVSLIKYWPSDSPLSLALLGGSASFLKVLRLIARMHLAQPIPNLRHARIKTRQNENVVDQQSMAEVLWLQLHRLLHREEEINLYDLLQKESALLLKESTAFSNRYSLTCESEHPYKGSNDTASVKEFFIPDALGLIVNFDRRCKLSEADTLTIYLDEKCTKPVKQYNGPSLSQFVPEIIPGNRFWIRFQKQNGVLQSDPQWGYLFNISPTNEQLNLALWLSEFLAEEAAITTRPFDNRDNPNTLQTKDQSDLSPREGSIYGRLYHQLAQYLRICKVPEIIRTIIVQLLRRLLQLAIDNFISDWNKGGLRKRKSISQDESSKEGVMPVMEKNEKGGDSGSEQLHQSAEEEQTKQRCRRASLRNDLKQFNDSTEALEEEMFNLLCEVDILHSPYLQNLVELVVLKRKISYLVKCNPDDSISLATLSFYPQSLDTVPESFPQLLKIASSQSSMAESAMHEGIRNFNSLAALDDIIACYFGEKEFPRSFFAEFQWDPRSIYLNKQARLSSLNKPKLTNEGKLTERAQMVYTEVFYRFGVSQPGTMSPEELNMLQVHCHPNEPLSADDLRHFFSKYHTEAGRLTLQGFLSLYYHDAYNHPKHSWEELQRLGYDSELAITEATAYKWCAPTRWSRARDEQLIELVNYLSEKTGKLALDLTPDDICITTDVERQHYDQLQLIPPVALKLRFCCMKQFNILVSKALPFIDLTQHEVEGSLAQRLCALRHLIFYVIKAQFLDSILARTASSRVSPSISVSRMKSVLRSSREFISNSGPELSLSAELASRENTVFMQVYKQLANVNPAYLRQNERAFKVTLRGERVEGEVGPYQETISQLCSELQPDELSSTSSSEIPTTTTSSSSSSDGYTSSAEQDDTLPLFVPCPNRQQAMQLIGVGENRDKFILKPSSNAPEHLQMFEFVGKLMGIAARTKSILSLNLPALFWKPLVGDSATLADLKSIDYSTMESIQCMLEMDKELFAASIFQNWTTSLSDKTIVELVAGGKEKPLLYEERHEYVALTQQARLHESDNQLKSILKGIGTIIPLPLLQLFTWQDLEMRVCGRTEINLQVLRRNTRYRAGINERDPHIQYFWKVLEDFGHHERMLFLRFAWGRQRLPSESELKNEPLKIFPFPCDNPDNRLPHAETCFFNIKLPAYSSVDVMRERLLYAITHTKTIDADVHEENVNDLLARAGRGRGRGGRFFGGLGAVLFGRPAS